LKRVLYIGWIGYKNLGDELMFDLFKQHFYRLGNQYSLDVVNNEERFLKNANLNLYDLIVLGGGSILSSSQHFVEPHIIKTLDKALSLSKQIMIWGSGIDWVSKEHLQHLINKNTLALSETDEDKLRVKRVFEESVWSGVRGPLTHELLKNYGVEKNLHVSGDPGFLLTRSKKYTSEKMILGQKVDQYEKIAGVNWGTTFNAIYGQDEIQVEDQMADALNSLIDQGYLIYLYLVWGTDVDATERLYSKLTNKESVILDKTLYNQDELMTIIEQFTFTINFKLHANFLSLAAQIPFIALGYRFKIFDFAKSVDLENFVISTDDPDIVNKIFELESEITKNKSIIIEKLKSYQNYYTDLITEPFDHNLYL
jgi:polysaccharide pyruvyl transferase WcaK-like protein